MAVDERAVRNRLLDVQQRRRTLVDYLEMKGRVEDWHGCADAANDLREMDTEIQVLTWVLTEGRKEA